MECKNMEKSQAKVTVFLPWRTRVSKPCSLLCFSCSALLSLSQPCLSFLFFLSLKAFYLFSLSSLFPMVFLSRFCQEKAKMGAQESKILLYLREIRDSLTYVALSLLAEFHSLSPSKYFNSSFKIIV